MLLRAVGSKQRLGTNVLNLARPDPRDGFAYCDDKREKIRHAVRASQDYYHPEWQYRKVVLFFQFPIHRDERVDLATNAHQEVSVLHAGPTEPLHGQDVVIWKLRNQIVRNVLVKQDAHWSTRFRGRVRVRQWLVGVELMETA